MKVRRLRCCGLALTLVWLWCSVAIGQDIPGTRGTPSTPVPPAAAQTAPIAASPETPTLPAAPPSPATRQDQLSVAGAPEPPPTSVAPESDARDAVRLGVDYTLPAGSAARDVIVIGGSATIEGHVEGDATVVFGELHLASTSLVDGDIVSIGGRVTVDAGAQAAQDLVVVASALQSPPGFVPGGEQTIIGPPVLGDGLRVLMPWATRGLLWGRPLVPDLPWIWGLIAIVFLVYLILNVVCDGPVRACVEKLTERPLSTFLTGLLVLSLIGPVAVVLAVSVIGLAVIPFMVCALFIAGILGKVSVLRAMGGGVVRQDELDNRVQSARSFAIGFVVVAAMYMVPVLGFVAFGTVGVLGLGAAALVFVSGIRRENPIPAAAPSVLPTYVVGPLGNDASEPGLPGTEGVVAAAPPAIAVDLALLPKASFTIRLGAFVLDLLLVLLTFGLLGLTRPNRILILLLLYRIGLWTWLGTTIGGIICQLRVVRTDGTPLRLADALVRGLSSVFSFAVLGIGYLWIFKDADRQAWHDKIAGTFVVKVPKHWPLT